MKLKHVVGIAGLAVFLASWIAVGVGYLVGVEKGTWVVLVVVAACASEGLFWCVAFMLGVGIVEARSKIWGWVKNAFRSQDRISPHLAYHGGTKEAVSCARDDAADASGRSE